MNNKIANKIYSAGILYVFLILGGLPFLAEFGVEIIVPALVFGLMFSLIFFGAAELIELQDKQLQEVKALNEFLKTQKLHYVPNNSLIKENYMVEKFMDFSDLPDL